MPASQTPSAPSNILPPLGGVQVVYPNTGTFTPAGLNLFQQVWAGVFGGGGVTPGLFLLGFADGINFNLAGDKAIPITLPVGAIGWRAQAGMIFGTNGTFATARAGIYQLAFQGGVVLLGQTALSAITAVGFNTPGAVASSLTPGTSAIWKYTTVYLNVGTPEGATSQGNFYLYGYPVY
jgi:hypothetical protein